MQARLYIPTKVQRLTYEDKQFEDGMTLGHYNIQNNSVLHLEVLTRPHSSASSSTAPLNLNSCFCGSSVLFLLIVNCSCLFRPLRTSSGR